VKFGDTKATSFIYLRPGQDNGVAIPGRPEAGDHFGASVRGAQMDIGCRAPQAAIGVPGEDIGGAKDAGEVDLDTDFDEFQSPCPGSSAFNLGPNASPGDHLGAAVGVDIAEYDGTVRVAFGAPGADVATSLDAGVVIDRYGRTVFTQSNGATTGAHYGAIFDH
jgi:hypothetical protein